MRWVRSSRRFGGLIALIALALQMAVSFGHVHLDSVHRAGPPVATAGASAQARQPAQQPSSDAADYCAICASIYLAATSFTPQAPQLSVPFGGVRVEHAPAAVSDVAEPRRLAFHSRAPPQA